MTSKTIATLQAVAALSLAAVVPMRAAHVPPRQTADKTALQQTLLASTGGDKKAGRAIFDKVCVNCHKFGDAGKEIGPDLSGIAATRKRTEIIESLLWPSKLIADQYQPVLIQTKDGDVVSGLVLKENARAVTMVTSDHPEKPVEILKSKIQDRQKSTVSAMPENLLDPYTTDQIAGLIALLLAGPGLQ
jgi:putative heme-binding domain-containing protein